MYALLTLLVTLAMLALEFRRRGIAGWRPLYVAAILAALLTHYFAAVYIAAAFLAGAFVLPAAGDRRRVLAGWLALHAICALVYLPLLLLSRNRLAGWTATSALVPPLQLPVDILLHFSRGLYPPPGSAGWLVLVGVFVLAGVFFGLRSPARRPLLVVVIWLLLPTIAMIILSLRQPYYQPRFVLPALPAFVLLLSLGIRYLAARLPLAAPRREQAAALAGLLVLPALNAEPLWREWTDRSIWRDDYRGVAQAIDSMASDTDAIILVAPGQTEILDYYVQRELPRYPLPRMRPIDIDATITDLVQISSLHRRLYGVYYVPYEADPSGEIQGWLQEHTFTAHHRWYGGVELVIYELARPEVEPLVIDALFAATIRLQHALVAPTEMTAGEAIRIETEWHTESAIGRPLMMFVHLLDAHGQIMSQFDGPPSRHDTGTWQPGEVRHGRMALLIPAETPAGSYELIIGLYDPANGERLRLADGRDSISLGRVHVQP